MDSYVIAERKGNVFTVTKFTDRDIPDHVATVTPSKRKVVFDYYHPATPSTIQKYMDLVNKFIEDNKPSCFTYFYDNDKVGSHNYGA